MDDKKKRGQSFEYGATVLLCSTLAVKLIGAVFKIPLSSNLCLGDVGYGYFTSAYELYTPIYSLAMSGLPLAVSRVVAEHMEHGRFKDVRQTLYITRRLFLFTGLIGFVLMLILTFPYSRLTDATGRTTYSILSIAPSLLFCCVMSTYRGYYEGFRDMIPTAVSDIIEALGKLILGFGFAFVTIRITGDVAYGAAAAMIGISIGAMLSAFYLRLHYRFKGDLLTEKELESSPVPIPAKEASKALLLIAVPIVLSSLANNIASLVDVTMVKWQLSHLAVNNVDTVRAMYARSIADYNNYAKTVLTNEEIPTFLYGLRGKAFTIYNLIPTITSVLGVSALPVLATSWLKRDNALIKKNMESMLKMTALIAMPAGIGCIVLSHKVMGLLYSGVASVEIGGPILRIFGFAAVFAGIAIPVTSMLQAIGRQVIALRNIAIGAFFKIIVSFILVGMPTINILGAPIGTMVCYLYVFVANMYSLIKYTQVVPNFGKAFFKPFVAAVACGITAYLISSLGSSRMNTLTSIGSGAVVYLAVLILLNTVEAEDLINLPKGEKLLSVCKRLKIVRK